MVQLRALAILSMLAAALFLWAPPRALALGVDPFLNTSTNSSLFYFEPCCSGSSNGGPGAFTATTTNGSDIAEAFTNPLANFGNFGPMGVAATMNDIGTADASASYNDAWFCYGFCGSFTTGINVFLNINGTATNALNAGFLDLEVDLEIGTGSLHFSYSQDIDQATPDAVATVDGNRIPVTLTQDPTTQDWSFSLSLDTTLTICSQGFLICGNNVPIICGDGCSLPTFTTSESATLEVEGQGPAISLDAFDPIGFGFTSDNPNTVIENAEGFAAPVVVPTAVPEPGSCSILIGGLAGLGWLRRRRRTRA